MSLRLLYRLAVSLLILGAAALLAGRFWSQQPSRSKLGTDFRALAELAEPSRGSVLRVAGPGVEYTLPAATRTVRILTNASLGSLEAARAQRRAEPDKRWRYAIGIEELDGAGKTLRRRVHHLRRELVEVELPGGLRGTGSFYLENGAATPLPVAMLRLDLSGLDQLARLRVRLVGADAGIADVLVRVALPAPATRRGVEATWNRMSDGQRQKLARSNVFPPGLLSEDERRNLIESRWRPLGPSSEAPARDIYVLSGDEVGAPVDPEVPATLATGPSRVVSVQLPERGGEVRIVLEALDARQRFPARVALRWIGHSAFERRAATHQWQGGRFETTGKFGGGWLELHADREASVRIWLVGRDAQTEITPPLEYLRAWSAHNDSPLEFALSHAGGMPTPLRLTLRRLAAAQTRLSDAPVQVSFLGGGGELRHVASVKLRPVASRHDAPSPDGTGMRVSDPVEAFFNVPPGVRRIRIAAADPVLANAFVRPADLARAVRTPEDATAPEAAQTAVPAWFALQPLDHDARILNGASDVLTVQGRPPEDRPELAAGRYRWEDFDPVDDGAARVFLAPREAGVPERADAVGTTFRPISRDARVTIVAEPGHASARPRIAWAAENPGALRYTVLVDGREWARGAASGIAGEFTLPALAPGAHRIEIAASRQVRWYASHLARGAPWIRRSAYRFDQPLAFDIERTSGAAEFVAVRLFRPAGARTRMTVRASIAAPGPAGGIGPHPGWLFAERVHDVRPSGELALPVAETAGAKTDAGMPFFIPIPDGAPRGRYRVTLTPEGGTAWVALSRVNLGAGAKPKLILESASDAD
ncbi:hypothetical protein [Massilia glaciei]|uniref:Uncharacterized protein n=1 Tax=Massilia glaciei TaxID=1524097 RepID=A0A2U2HNG1_9BURK|nr:hypothetical protein [Massilia glaciei]PWF49037.1 hypothetical protein C7C56_009150 [Massilia glaciei]